MMFSRFRPPLLLVAAVLFALAGCGGSSNAIWVTGKILKGGAKYSPPEGQRLGITFYATEITDASGKTGGSNEPFAATFNAEDGTFTIPGPDGRGIPPGKYRVAIIQKDDPNTANRAPSKNSKGKVVPYNRETDFLKGQFNPSTSSIVRELKTPSEIEIDLDKPTG